MPLSRAYPGRYKSPAQEQEASRRPPGQESRPILQRTQQAIMLRWASRCLPGFSILALLVLLARTSNSIWTAGPQDASSPSSSLLSVAQQIFIVYTAFVHTNLLAFAVRLSCSLCYTIRQTKEVLARRRPSSPFREVPTSPTQKLPEPEVFEVEDEVVHAIILPNYGEDLHTLRTTLNVLASHPRASTQYEVYLAMEQKESDVRDKAAKLLASFEGSFLDIQSTFHPCNLPGEIAGKSSNVAFAARHIVQVHRAELSSCNVIVTVMDGELCTAPIPASYDNMLTPSSRHPSLARLLYRNPSSTLRAPRRRPHAVRVSDHLRPQLARKPYSRAVRGSPLGVRRPVHHVPGQCHCNPHLSLLAALVPGRESGWVG